MSKEEYTIIKKLGANGFGAAYLCHKANDPQRKFVMRTMKMDGLETDKAKIKIQEADVLKGLACPFIVKCEDAFVHQWQVEDSRWISYVEPHFVSNLVIVTEYCGGGDLKKQIEQHKENGTSFNENAVKNILYQMAIALNRCHSQNVLHRDVESENIFVSIGNTYKLGDFGCGKVLDQDIPLSKVRYGWNCYGPPEIWHGKSYSSQSDIWALGSVMYEVMNLHRPFEQKGPGPLIQAICKGEFKPTRNNYTLNLRDLVASMLSVDPDQRPSAEQILEHKALQYVK